MGDHSHGSPNDPGTVAKAGQGSVESFQDPGLPPHRPRLADVDPRAAKRAERQVTLLFVVSILGTALFFVAYFVVGRTSTFSGIRLQNTLLGLGTAFAMMGIGVGIVHWAKTLMPDHEITEMRHEIRPEAERQEAEAMIGDILDETGIKRRPLIRNSLIAAVALAPIPAIFMFRDLDRTGATANEIVDRLRYTMWDKDTKLVRDPSGTPIKASDVQIGSAFHVIPEGLDDPEDPLNEKAKAVV
ncbi:MAG: ubiquinol-cytochrome C reductase, partial [Micrococcaceae bacterium]|nr:ubiquinol-cytochrome C reductase [Micrococcaceae bacterium]